MDTGRWTSNDKSLRAGVGVARWIAVAATTVVTMLPMGSADAELGHTQAASTEVQPAGHTERASALVAWAADRFRAAGLEIPKSAVVFSDSTQRCGGFEGR